MIVEKIFALYPFLKELEEPIMAKRISQGTIVFDEGDRCGGVAFLLKGTIRVSKVGRNGREVVLYRLKKGDSCILTISSVLNNLSFPATAIVEEETEAVILSVSSFKKLMSESPLMQQFVYKLLAERLLEVMTLIDEIIFRKLDERLCQYLLEHSREDGDMIKITHDELAIELGTAREVVSRILKAFEREGMVQISRGKIQIVSRKLLNNKSRYFSM